MKGVKFSKFINAEIQKFNRESVQNDSKLLEHIWEQKAAVVLESFTRLLNSLRTAIYADTGVHPKEEYEREAHQPDIERHFYQNTEENEHIENLKSILSEDYNPPDDIINFLSHIKTVGLFYIHTASISTIVPSHWVYKVDWATLQLSNMASIYSAALKDEGHKQFRITMGINKKANKILEKKQPVLEEYYRIDRGMKPHRIATTIKANLEKWPGDVPSVDTIKRYLKKEKLI